MVKEVDTEKIEREKLEAEEAQEGEEAEEGPDAEPGPDGAAGLVGGAPVLRGGPDDARRPLRAAGSRPQRRLPRARSQ